MRLAIVADIHGNLTALEAVLEDLRTASPDLVLHGGDLAANGSRPAEVVDRIRDLGWPGVCGNTDEMLWSPGSLAQLAAQFPKLQKILETFQEMIPTTCEWLGEERLRWLQELPNLHRQDPVALLHASPGNLWQAPMPTATDPELQDVYSKIGSSVAIYAHIHRPFVRKLQAMTIANTGSVSLSYDGDPRASYLLLDGAEATIRRVEYDVEREAGNLLCSRLPHAAWLAQMLRAGRYQPPA